jgi:hypothetical protein
MDALYQLSYHGMLTVRMRSTNIYVSRRSYRCTTSVNCSKSVPLILAVGLSVVLHFYIDTELVEETGCLLSLLVFLPRYRTSFLLTVLSL